MTAETPTDVFAARREPQTRNSQNSSPTFLSDPARLSRFLGWFSVGLGAAELFMPRTVAKIAGTKKNNGLVRFYGMREIAAGVGIFTQPNPSPWLWMRVAGDVVDLASLIGGARKGRRAATIGSVAAVAGVTALDVLCAQRCSAQSNGAPEMKRAEASVLIARPPAECYGFWRNIENHQRFTPELGSARITGDRTSHWTVQLPGTDRKIEWDAEIVEDVPNQRISWRTLPESAVTVNGSVTFEPAPGNRGTFVRVQTEYSHPGASILSPAARLTGKHPEQIIYKSLRRMKQLLEVGEIIETEGQPAGRRSSTTWLDSLAR